MVKTKAKHTEYVQREKNQMTEFVCPKNPKHTLKPTDNDDSFEQLTCVSCGSVIYKPIIYSQKPEVSSSYSMPESYVLMDDIQEDIDDDETAFNLLCSETCRLY